MKIKKNTGILFVILLFIIIIIMLNMCRKDFTEFNADLWAENPLKREQMLNNLLTTYKLEGKNREEILLLLGTNDATITNQSIIYTIGADFFSNHFIIEFDSNDNVISYRVYSD